MPIPKTRLNQILKLQHDICNNSFLDSAIGKNHILTCDISDAVIMDNGVLKYDKVYLNSKANYLIHPYSKIGNCVTKFNNEKKDFQYKQPIRCNNCNTSTSSIATEEEYVQKIIQNQVRQQSSLRTTNLAALYTNSNNLKTANNTEPRNKFNSSDRQTPHGLKIQHKSSIKPNYGIDIKHNSYDRYLAKKKSQYLKQDASKTIPPPPNPNSAWPTYWGNKTMKYGIKNCPC